MSCGAACVRQILLDAGIDVPEAVLRDDAGFDADFGIAALASEDRREMAGRPLEAFALISLGFNRLSMPPAGIGPVKRMVLSLDVEAARRGLAPLLKSGSGSVRNEIETLARKLNVAL